MKRGTVSAPTSYPQVVTNYSDRATTCLCRPVLRASGNLAPAHPAVLSANEKKLHVTSRLLVTVLAPGPSHRCRVALAATILAMALISAAPVAAGDLPDWAPPTWMQGSWGLSAHGAVVSVVATPDNVAVTMTVDGTRVLFDAVDTASDGPWRVASSKGTTDAGATYYEVSMQMADSAYTFMFHLVSTTELTLHPSVTEDGGETQHYGPILLRKGPQHRQSSHRNRRLEARISLG